MAGPGRRAAWAALTAALALGLLELLAHPLAPPRAAPPGSDGALHPSAELGWEVPPGPSRAFGVRGATVVGPEGTRAPPPRERPAGGLRLMTLGDSTVYGVLVGDHEVFSAVAAQHLEARLGRPVDAVNGGVPGYSTVQALRMYEGRLRGYRPDVLLIATQWSDAQLAPAPDALRFRPAAAGPRELLAHSALFRLLEGILHGWQPVEEVRWRLEGGDGVRRVPLPLYRQNLDRMVQIAEADGAMPVLLWLPSQRDQARQPLDAPRPAYRAAMAELAAARGLLLIDGATPFQGAQGRVMLDDVHPSAEGHALLGKIVADALHPLLRR